MPAGGLSAPDGHCHQPAGFLFPARADATEYDLMAVDEDMDSYQFSFAIDLDSDDLVFSVELTDLQ